MKQVTYPLIIIILFASLQTNAQQTAYFFKDNIYNLNYNPAREIKVRGHFSLPGISNINLQLNTNMVTYQNIISTDEHGYKVIDPKGLFKGIAKNSYGQIGYNLNMELLGFGFRTSPKTYISYSNRLRTEGAVFIPKSLVRLITDGNLEYIDEDINISPLGSVLAYNENAIGIQYKVNEMLTIGVRGKFLIGLANAHIKESDFSLLTDSEWNLHLKGSVLVNTYIPVDNIPYSFFSSMGGGFDLGATIKLPLNFGVNVSVIDLGWIRWNQENAGTYSVKVNPNSSLYQNGELVFSGLDFHYKLGDNISRDSLFDFTDSPFSVDSLFLITEESSEHYTTIIHPKIFLEGYYSLKGHTISSLVRFDFVGKRVLPSLTFGYNLNIKKVLDIAVSYTIAQGSYRNLGIGFSLNPGDVFHFYLATDNLLTLFRPHRNNAVSIQTGIFFTIPSKKSKQPANAENGSVP